VRTNQRRAALVASLDRAHVVVRLLPRGRKRFARLFLNLGHEHGRLGAKIGSKVIPRHETASTSTCSAASSSAPEATCSTMNFVSSALTVVPRLRQSSRKVFPTVAGTQALTTISERRMI
jgi:hypothetical protein